MLQKSNPDHPRLCSRRWRWKLLPITFLTCDILHQAGQSISKFLKSDLWHFRYSFNTCSSSLSRFTGLDVRKTSWERWVQAQRWHTTLMGRNFHPKVAAFLSSIRTLAQKAGDFMGEPWTKAVSTLKSYSVDAEHEEIRRCPLQFHQQGKKGSKFFFFFFQIFICLRCTYLTIFKTLPMKGASLPAFHPGSPPSLQAPRGAMSCGTCPAPQQLSHHLWQLYLHSCPPVTLQGSQAGVWITSLQRIRVPWGKAGPWESLACTAKGAALKEQARAAEGWGGGKSWKIRTASGFTISYGQIRAEQQKESPKCSFAALWHGEQHSSSSPWWRLLWPLKERDTPGP